MKIKPTRCVALIRPDKVEDKSSGGIYLPDSARDRMQVSADRGELIDFGEGFYEGLDGPVPKKGDRVMFDKYAGTLIKVEEDGVRVDYRLVNDDKIIAILEE